MQYIKLFESFKKIFYSDIEEEIHFLDSNYIHLYSSTPLSREKYIETVSIVNNLLKFEAFRIIGEYKDVHMLHSDILKTKYNLNSFQCQDKYDHVYKSLSKNWELWKILKPYYEKIKEYERKGIIINLSAPFATDEDEWKGFYFNGRLVSDDNNYHANEVSEWEIVIDTETNQVTLIFQNNGNDTDLNSPDDLDHQKI